MKKKFGIIVSVMLVLVMLIGTLVACKEDPKKEHGKDKLPTGGAATVSRALPEILGLWMESNSYGGEDILAWDMRFDYVQGEKSSLGIDFKGALTNGNNDDVFELSVTDNKKDTADKTVIGIIVNKEASYLNVLGKSFKIAEVNLNSLSINTGTEEGFDSALDMILEIVGLVGGLADDGTSTVAVSKAADGSYTRDYSLSIDIWGFLEALEIDDLIIGLLEKEGIVGQEDLVAQLVGALEGVLKDNIVKINASVTDLVLEETIDELEEDIYYTYDLTGGKVSPDSISIGLKDSKGAIHDVAISGLEIINTMPSITIPTVNVTEISILKHEITGNFTMKNNDAVAGTSSVVSNYSYKIHIEFSATDIVRTISQCIEEKSPAALIDQLLINQDGKIFIDVYHTCPAVCVEHMAGNKFDGSILTIAYDPAEDSFNNNSVYVSAHLKAILPNDILSVVGITGLAAIPVKLAIPSMLSFVIDPLLFYEMDKLRNPAGAEGDSPTVDDPATPDTDAPDADASTIDIAKVIKSIIAAVTTPEGTVEIDFAAVTKVLLDDLGLDAATKAIVTKVLDQVFPAVTTLSINAVYTNGSQLEEDFNTMNAFMQLNETTKKVFNSISGREVLMTGDYVYTNKIDTDNVKITSDILYNEDGTQRALTHQEFMSMISTKEDSSSEARVAATYKGTDGVITHKSDFRIIGVIGLDPEIIDTPQTVNLVLSRGSGASIFKLFDLLGGAGGAFLEELKELQNIYMSEAMVQTTITLSEVKSEVWTQVGIGDVANHIDSTKEYSHTDEIVTQYTFNRTYTNNKVETYTVAPTNDIFNTMNADTKTSTFKVYADATLNYSAGNGKYTKNVPIKFNEASVVDTDTINGHTRVTIDFAKEIMNKTTNKNLVLSTETATSIMDAFVAANIGKAEYVINKESDTFVSVGLTFSVAGEYGLTIKGTAGDAIVYTIVVETNEVVDTIFEGDNVVGEPTQAFTDVPIAIGLIKTDKYAVGDDVVTTVTEFTSVMKGDNLDIPAVIDVDYTINAETGKVTFLTVGSYVFNLVFGERTYTVHFNALSDEIESTIVTGNEEVPLTLGRFGTIAHNIDIISTKTYLSGITNIEESKTAATYTVTGTVGAGGTAPVIGTDYSFGDIFKNRITFKTAGTYIVSCTLHGVTVSKTYTVTAAA